MKRAPRSMRWVPLLIMTLVCADSPASSQKRQFQFEQYPATVYHGRTHVPRWLHKEKDGSWTYENGKSAWKPRITFAGEYDLDGISCGTDCRFYKLTDLKTGVDIPAIRMFDGAEPLPETTDGHPYLTILYYKPNSSLLIAEYHLDFDNSKMPQICRQRYFVLEDSQIHPISTTFPFCTEDREP